MGELKSVLKEKEKFLTHASFETDNQEKSGAFSRAHISRTKMKKQITILMSLHFD